MVVLTASTGAKIWVWREADVFNARRTDTAGPPESCLPIDLFEVIAELAGLDLDEPGQAAEAIDLAAHAHRRLAPSPDAERADRDHTPAADGECAISADRDHPPRTELDSG